MKDNPSYFAIITADVRYDERLKPNEKLLFGEITALSNKDGYCRASNKYFSKLYKVSPETISRWVSNLNKCGYVKPEIVYKEGTKQIIRRRLYPLTNKSIPIDEKINTPIDEKVKVNNTSNNNTSKNKEKTNKKEKLDLSNLDSLIDIEVAKEWIAHRKAKKCPIEKQSTFDRQMKQAIESSNQTFQELGLSPNEVIEKSIDAGWQGIGEPEWLRNRFGVKANTKRENYHERTERETKEYLQQRSRLVAGDAQQIPCALGRQDGVKLV